MPYTLALGMEGNFCWAEGFSSRKIAVVWCGCFLLIGWIIPIIVMTGLYTLMARKLKMGEKRHANNPDSFDRIRKENRRVAKMFTTIVCIFFLLTMPYSAFYFTLAYLEYAGPPNKGEHDRLLQANYGLFVLTLINCSTNPLIYARMHSKVREAMNMYFCCGKIFQNRQKNDNLLTEL